MDLGPHALFIVAAYAVTALIISGLIVRAVLDHRAQLRTLAEMEGRGLRRRSEQDEPRVDQQDGGQAAASRFG
jgi:heme exporter protein D